MLTEDRSAQGSGNGSSSISELLSILPSSPEFDTGRGDIESAAAEARRAASVARRFGDYQHAAADYSTALELDDV